MNGWNPVAQDALAAIAAEETELLAGVDPQGGDAAAPPAVEEPVFTAEMRHDIQGNIFPGFNKDHQHFLFYRFRELDDARHWLRGLAPDVTSMDEVLAFVREHRARRLAEGVREPAELRATWVNVALSHRAVAALRPADAGLFREQSFRDGLAARSTYLGDPSHPGDPAPADGPSPADGQARSTTRPNGHREHWVVGGPGNEADALVIVAADDPDDLAERVAAIRAGATRLDLLFEETEANALPGNLRGHEHFGFKDGVSQPGLRGVMEDGTFLTPRHLVRPPAGADPEPDIRPDLFGRPGQLLLWPGEFLLGLPRQNPEDLLAPAPPTAGTPPYPEWARLGSYLVCRRLHQDVAAFWEFAARAAVRAGTTPRHLASMLVGRWPNGAPLMRAKPGYPASQALAGDEYANNHFLYDDHTAPVELDVRVHGMRYRDRHPQARGDMLGTVCPHFAHIRKTNPRDSATDLGKPHDSMLRMILRRGIAYGPLHPLHTRQGGAPADADADRGLMFVCYGATIEDQFEFLTRRWSNSPIQPNAGGHDPVIGQRDAVPQQESGDEPLPVPGPDGEPFPEPEPRGEPLPEPDAGDGPRPEPGAGDDVPPPPPERTRWIDVPTADGTTVRVTVDRDFVVPTGGGYFFAPPISALTGALGSADDATVTARG